jgi:hypothetical protein
MSGLTSCQNIRLLLGVYVVGAIDPAERSMVDAHLPGCKKCREELAGLAGLPALLGRVPAEEAAAISGFSSERGMPLDRPASELLSPLLTQVAHRRRVRRWRGLAAAAAVALVATGSALGAMSVAAQPTAGSSGYWTRASATAPGTHETATIRFQGTAWGTRLAANVSGIPVGTTCQFWVVGANGVSWPAGGWTVSWNSRDTWFDGSTWLHPSAVRGFEITSDGRMLVHVSVH